MGFNDYILTCEKENKELKKDLEYYKNKNTRLYQQNKKYKEAIDKIKEICASVPEDWTICGVEKIHEIEEILKEVKR